MKISDQYITATYARNNFFELLAGLKNKPYPVNITVNGIPEAIIMDKEEYDSWIATYETMSDPELVEKIKQSEIEFSEGRYKTLAEVEKELGINPKIFADKSKKKYVCTKTRQPGRKRSKKTGSKIQK